MRLFQDRPSWRNFLRWFIPLKRKTGSWAFVLNRVTALGLLFYLCLHLVMLYQLAQGPQAYDSFIAFAKSPIIKFSEMFVIAGGILHGLNGVRIILNSFGIGVRRQKVLFYSLMTIAAVGISFFAYRMFFGA